MSDLAFINDFWVQTCPFFSDFSIIYLILDIVTIISFLRIIFYLPAKIMTGWRHKI